MSERRRLMMMNGDVDYSKKYLTMEILSGGYVEFRSNNTSANKTILYRKNGGDWTEITGTTSSSARILQLVQGDILEFKGNNTAYGVSAYLYVGFKSTSRVNVYGNVMSLIYGDNFVGMDALTENYSFVGLFWGTLVVSAENLILPEYLSECCFRQFFYGCTTLVTPPLLPSTHLTPDCYRLMFSGCTGLTEMPELPATTLAARCYYEMFSGCTGLTRCELLPAITLRGSGCYAYMFQNCSNLSYIKAMFTTTPSNSHTNSWVNGVATTGTFVKNSAATWDVIGTNGIPEGWTVQTASA